MINKCLALFMCLWITGCASMESSQPAQEYSTIYGNALNTGDVTIVVRNESYQQLKQGISEDLTNQGYTKVIFVNPKQGFIVLAKQDDTHPSRIILKYTATAGEDKTEIDLVKVSDDLSTDSTVSQDIQAIAGLIRDE